MSHFRKLVKYEQKHLKEFDNILAKSLGWGQEVLDSIPDHLMQGSQTQTGLGAALDSFKVLRAAWKRF